MGIEVAQQEAIVNSKRKYALNIINKTSMTNCRSINSLMDPNIKLIAGQGEHFLD